MGMNGSQPNPPAADTATAELIAYMEQTIQRLDDLSSAKGIVLLMEALAETCYRRGDVAQATCKDPQAQDFWNSCGHWYQAGALALTGQWGRGKTIENNVPGKKVMP